MARSKETFNKRDQQQKKLKQRKEKEMRKEERKANSQKGKGLDEMMAYLDEDGNLSDTPPDPRKAKTFNAEDILIQVPEGNNRNMTRTGILEYFNDEKGYGFIIDKATKEKFFVHATNLLEVINISDKVLFDTERGIRGMAAINVKKVR